MNDTLKKISNQIGSLLTNNSNSEIFSKYVLSEYRCLNFSSSLFSNPNSIPNFFLSSTFASNHIEDEDECIENENTYIFLTYNINITKSVSYNSSKIEKMYHFLGVTNNTNFYKSLCLPVKCKKYYKNFFDMEKNYFLEDFLNKRGIVNVKANYLDEMKESNVPLKVIMIVLLAYSLFRILCSFISYLINNSNEESEEEEKTEMNESSNRILSNPIKAAPTEKKNLISQFLSCFSIVDSINHLTGFKNEIYCEEGIIELSGIKFLCLLFLILSQNSFEMMCTYNKSEDNLTPFLTDFLFVFIKLYYFVFENLKVLNGIILGYKFITYIQKRGEDKFSFLDMLKFYLKSLVYIISFLIFFWCFEFYILEIGLKLFPYSQYFYRIQDYKKRNKCLTEPSIIFIPFKLQYFTQNNSSSCYNSAIFIINEFYCFTFVVWSSFLLIRLKKQKIELLLFLLNFICILSTFILSNEFYSNSFDLNINTIHGPISSILAPHIFFNIYFLAFNIGIVFFYYKDITKLYYKYSRAITEKGSSQYMPFKYCYVIGKKIGEMKEITKNVIIVISLLLMLLVTFCSYYLIGLKIKKSYYVRLEKKDLFLLILENTLYSLLFSVFILFFLLTKSGFFLKVVSKSRVFTFVNRISFTFTNISNFVVAFSNGAFHVDMVVDNKNIHESSCPILILTFILSFIFVILFEVPLKYIFRNWIFSSHKGFRLTR